MTRTAGAPMGCQRPSRFWGLGCPKIYHEAEDTLEIFVLIPGQALRLAFGDNGAGFLEQALHIGRPGIVIGVDD
ncbi:hypothetical protein, partial [Thiolapillus sp.]|uniref:hypothetical protein n=1 Tax=Thiolapillus sp. TaxID=2017437 RepID=UPI003AF76972